MLRLAGTRNVLDEHRTTTTPTLKSGKPGKTKVAYGDTDAAVALRRRRETAGELYGRVLVVCAAQHYAAQLVLPTSAARCCHARTARKAFERATKQALPASHARLQRALAAEAGRTGPASTSSTREREPRARRLRRATTRDVTAAPSPTATDERRRLDSDATIHKQWRNR